jgi:hypothetical protein
LGDPGFHSRSQAQQVAVSPFEQLTKRLEREIMDRRPGGSRPSSWNPFLSGDSPVQEFQAGLGEATAEVDPGVLAKKEADLWILGRAGQ